MNHLVVFGRLPHSSLPAKTRLGKEIDDEKKARDIGHSLTRNTLNHFKNYDGEKYFCYGGSIPKTDFEEIKNQFFQYHFFSQSKGKDVRGIQEAFEYIFEKDKNAHILLVGTDIIGLDTDIIQTCFSALQEYDACIVPVEDNGYGLVGVSKNIDIISEIKNFQSRSEGYHLVQETKNLCFKKNISLYIHSNICFDIDTYSDALRAGLL